LYMIILKKNGKVVYLGRHMNSWGGKVCRYFFNLL
jgi:hypothetical protein